MPQADKQPMTPAKYAAAVGDGMTEAEAAEQLKAAEIEAAYRRAVNSGRYATRLSLEIALLAYVNGQPLPLMSRRTMEKFNKAVLPYGKLLKKQ